MSQEVNFTINGKEHSVTTDHGKVGPKSVLLDYIRDEAGLKGTKMLCREGGCGACVVTIKARNVKTGEEIIRGVNSCLTPVLACDGWEIETIEALGNQKDGYHKIQDKLAKSHGTQCGYCSPGMCMNMYGLMGSNKKLTERDIEDGFDGNICRCTGYRPIMSAFKSIALEGSTITSKDMSKTSAPVPAKKCCGKSESCEEKIKKKFCWKTGKDGKECKQIIHLKYGLGAGEEWTKPSSLDGLFESLQRYKSGSIAYRFIGGNTGMGVYKELASSSAYIDLHGLEEELKKSEISSSGIVIGSLMTLTEVIKLLEEAFGKDPDSFKYAGEMATHIKRVANTPVRNAGTISGNLMLKYKHNDFPSDIFTLLESVGAKMTIVSAPNLKSDVTPSEFLAQDMNYKLITSIKLPILKESEGWRFRSFKITRRYQNAHAYINAAFLIKVDPKNNFKVIGQPSLVYAGVDHKFIRAKETEKYLLGKVLTDQGTLNGAFDSLEKEINPDSITVEASPEYRRNLCISLFYKTVLGIITNSTSPKVKSGAGDLVRNLMTSKQTYDTDDKSEWPIGQPVVKLEAQSQISGEAEYTNDIVKQNNELFAALVLTSVGKGEVAEVDPSEALQMPGIVDFVTAKDVPGVNNFASDPFGLGQTQPEEIFISKTIPFAGACVGMLLGESRELVFEAVGKVKIKYANVTKPVLSIEQWGGITKRVDCSHSKSPNGNNMIKGDFKIGHQYHMYMEPQSVLVVPKEDKNYDVFAATQFIKHSQTSIAQALGIPHHNINLQVKRIGGGYGGKVTRVAQLVAAAAVGAYKQSRPVRLILDLESSMKLMGKRLPHYSTYEAEFDDNGKIIDLKVKMTCDPGYTANESTVFYAMYFIQNCYKSEGWKAEGVTAKTDTSSNTWCRAPGSTEAISLVETVMEHIARVVKKDPLEVRAANYIKDGDQSYNMIPGLKFQGENPIPKMMEQVKASGEYANRKAFANKFNDENRWKKRGISIVPMRYTVHYMMYNLPVFLAVYADDGSVSITHGGVEMGQGIHTKVVQVIAKQLGIPMEKIKVKATNNLTGANAAASGGAVTSEIASYNAIKCCDQLKSQMQPIKEKLPNASWEELVAACQKEGVMLTATAQASSKDGLMPYDIYAVNMIEVEVDMLTGENKIVRCDLIEDAGVSISPEVDIGQIEGALTMGLGYWTMEKYIFDPDTGEVLTNNTWNYKVPLPRDIPEDFRVTLLSKAPNPFGVLRSKATGEPPMCLAVAVFFAIRDAIDSARKDAGASLDFFKMDGPATPEDILKYANTSKKQFVI